jgi:hypothetical protein
MSTYFLARNSIFRDFNRFEWLEWFKGFERRKGLEGLLKKHSVCEL